jgi:hypothetical protein
MILRDSLDNVRENTDNSKITVSLILQEIECVTNVEIGNNESEDIKIWDPKSIKGNNESEDIKIWDPKSLKLKTAENISNGINIELIVRNTIW